MFRHRKKEDIRQIIGEAVVAALEKGGLSISIYTHGGTADLSIHPWEPQETGRWLERDDEPGFCLCSACGELEEWKSKFCPNCDTVGGKSPEAHYAGGDDDTPHKVSMVVCLNCGKRWVAVRPSRTKLTDLECPQCHTQGAATETGEELEDDGE